jgi:phospholipase C
MAAAALVAGVGAFATAPAISAQAATTTPIKHLVVIFQENRPFDHYFGTYPRAENPPGEPPFNAAPGTPSVNGLSGPLLTHNPNGFNPQRLDRSQALTCKPEAFYTKEQKAFDHGLMDRFPQELGTPCKSLDNTGRTVLNYYDGNTVTGLWNYAQRFSLSDNSYGTGMGQSAPGALNLATGSTFGVTCGPADFVFNSSPCGPGVGKADPREPKPLGKGTLYGDADPFYDKCSAPDKTAAVGGRNIGDLLSGKETTWGWFEGGFASPGYVPGKPETDDPATVCTGQHNNIGNVPVKDYVPHHEPFQFYASTANPQHLPPTSIDKIGRQDQANHQYDLADFWAAAGGGKMPAVSFLKAAAYQDGHPGFNKSDPLDEQHFLVDTLNRLQKLPSWSSTAVMIAYDDSGGFYDHQMPPIIRQSQTPLDSLTGAGQCGANPEKVPTDDKGNKEQARCGLGPRLPLLVLSRYSKTNFVDNTLTEQASITRFIEDNWLGGKRVGNGSADASAGRLTAMFDFQHPNDKTLILDPITGEP